MLGSPNATFSQLILLSQNEVCEYKALLEDELNSVSSESEVGSLALETLRLVHAIMNTCNAVSRYEHLDNIRLMRDNMREISRRDSYLHELMVRTIDAHPFPSISKVIMSQMTLHELLQFNACIIPPVMIKQRVNKEHVIEALFKRGIRDPYSGITLFCLNRMRAMGDACSM